ncbi:PAS domain-containing sensor histidine kinase [Hymenobacter wooponensis]|uniref:histidine kinase n=1 Tax=Hymenobacter wooponensis TaxID=1525360 RepID=A0A4Z0MTH9_9BACT|nr:ATP-binding protein [Hymenobacter wooponensis]TGD82749.1 hypothetical protein EU557_02905 [Hymenobacter wooponensis]
MLEPATFFLNQAEASQHIHFIYDVEAELIVFVNSAYEQLLLGHSDRVNEELPGLLARLHPDDLPVLRRYWQLWTQGRIHDDIEFRLAHPNRSDQWFCLTPYWHHQPQGKGWLGGILRDISFTKEHEANALKFNSKKNIVLEILAHDLAGAFIMVQQLATYVQDELEPASNPRVLEMLQLMQSTSQHSVQLIHDLVDQEFLESSSVALRRERVDLREKLGQCLEPFRRAPGRQTQQLQYEAPPGPLYAEVDSLKIVQVVANLVGNAMKFTPDEGRITVQLEPCTDCVRIKVADEGIGIPQDLQAALFERFTQARRPGLRGEPTTGLGLFLCKTIVELHQGTISVESTEGQGSVFTVVLPLTEEGLPAR